jgi:hypothetical protein
MRISVQWSSASLVELRFRPFWTERVFEVPRSKAVVRAYCASVASSDGSGAVQPGGVDRSDRWAAEGATVSGRWWKPTQPAPARIPVRSMGWQDAEHLAVKHMVLVGFTDAQLTPSGADGGLDVRATVRSRR